MAARAVTVLGGGVAGLTAAHELAERGFAVTVVEPKALGGRARSMGVPGTASGGRLDLPGEHGFRFFPGFYQDIIELMSRIPLPGGTGTVAGNLQSGRAAVNALLARSGHAGSPCTVSPLPRPPQLASLHSIDEQMYRQGRPNIFEMAPPWTPRDGQC